MNLFGNTVKFLLGQRGLTAKELAERVNLSPTSLSKIVKGVSRPRQANLTRIIQELCVTPEEEQQLLSAFAHVEEELSEETGQLSAERFQSIEEDRVRRYLQVKSQSIAFRERVAEILRQSGQPFQGPHQNEDIICDFFLLSTPGTAIECKANPYRDWDRTLTSASLFRTELPCERVLVIVPDLKKIPAEIRKRAKSVSAEIVPIDKLASKL